MKNQMDAELGLRENNEHLDALSEQVAMLKGLTMEIDEEVKSQNSFLETMGAGMGGAWLVGARLNSSS